MKKTKSITLKLSSEEFKEIEKWAKFSFANLTSFCKTSIAMRIRKLEKENPSQEGEKIERGYMQ